MDRCGVADEADEGGLGSLGLGYLIIYGSQVFKLDLVLMSIVILCILAALMYQGIAMAERRAER